MNKVLLFIKTASYLKPTQIFYRLKRNFFKPIVKINYFKKPSKPEFHWTHIELYSNRITKKFEAKFLNRKKKLQLPNDWNDVSFSKLWTYNLHYFEDFLCIDSKKNRNLNIEFLNIWIDQNPIGCGIGWEPYPTSLRIVNLLKAWMGGLNLEERHLKNIYQQSSHLALNLEKDILANHYFVNLKAMLFSGLIFGNHDWINIGSKGLEKEINEQINESGFNFELSPMYNALMLVDILDIYNLVGSFENKSLDNIKNTLKKIIPKTLIANNAMRHPDGGVSFFNDSTCNVAPENKLIKDYANKLGFQVPDDRKKISFEYKYIHGGYHIVENEFQKLIFDTANIEPSYQPGHAHASTLSFEYSIGKSRFIVNSGISRYGRGAQREYERSTRAHSTVEIDEKSSSQVWSGFRVAKRAKILKSEANSLPDGFIMSGSHDGYNRIFKRCIHNRDIQISQNSLTIKDSIDGSYSNAISRFFFHPDLEIKDTKENIEVYNDEYILRLNKLNLEATLRDTYYYENFGKKSKNKCLEVEIKNSAINIVFQIFKKN